MEPTLIFLILVVGFFLTFLNRYWEYGLTLHYLFVFMLLLNYGVKVTLPIVFVLCPLAIYVGCRAGKFYFIHSVNGPMLQLSAILLFITLAVPFLYFLGPGAMLIAFMIPYVISQIYDIKVVNTFIGLDYYRLSTNTAMSVLIHYKMFTLTNWWQALLV